MSREVTEAHYLHERSGLEAVLRPPVQLPTALCWVPRKEQLVAATKEGKVLVIDPVLGTTQIGDGVGEASGIALHDDGKRYVVVSRDGTWQIGTLQKEVLHQGKHGFLGTVDVFYAGDYVVMVGDEAEGRYMTIQLGGESKGRARLPTRVIPTLDPNQKLCLARSVPQGLVVLPFGKDARFPKDESTAHRLQHCFGHILGYTPTGIAVWDHTGGQPRSMRLPDLSAGAISQNGSYLGLGTKGGAVALARMDQIAKRVRPDLVRAFNSPVTCVAFSTRGRWLATGAEGLRIWSWED